MDVKGSRNAIVVLILVHSTFEVLRQEITLILITDRIPLATTRPSSRPIVVRGKSSWTCLLNNYSLFKLIRKQVPHSNFICCASLRIHELSPNSADRTTKPIDPVLAQSFACKVTTMPWQVFKLEIPSSVENEKVPCEDSPISALSLYGDHMAIFFIAADGSVHIRYWKANEPWNGHSIAGPGSAAPQGRITSVSLGPSAVDVFWQGPDWKIHGARWRDGWQSYTSPIFDMNCSRYGGLVAAAKQPVEYDNPELAAEICKVLQAPTSLEITCIDHDGVVQAYRPTHYSSDPWERDLFSVPDEAFGSTSLTLATTVVAGKSVRWGFYSKDIWGVGPGIGYFLAFGGGNRKLGIIPGAECALGRQTIAACYVDPMNKENDRVILRVHVFIVTPQERISLYVGEAVDMDPDSDSEGLSFNITWQRNGTFEEVSFLADSTLSKSILEEANKQSQLGNKYDGYTYEKSKRSICAARRRPNLYEVYWTTPEGAISGIQISMDPTHPNIALMVPNPVVATGHVRAGGYIALLSRKDGEMELWTCSSSGAKLLAGTVESQPLANQIVDRYDKKAATISLRNWKTVTDDLLRDAFDIGQAKNIIPTNEAPRTGLAPRKVYIVTHPLPVFLNKVFIHEMSGFLKDIGDAVSHSSAMGQYKDKPFPNPAYHWAVVVGDYEHELNADRSLEIWYQHKRISPSTKHPGQLVSEGTEWEVYPAGETKYNDQAIQIAGKLNTSIIKISHFVY